MPDPRLTYILFQILYRNKCHSAPEILIPRDMTNLTPRPHGDTMTSEKNATLRAYGLLEPLYTNTEEKRLAYYHLCAA
jgi:hypothetical protein